MQTSTARVVLFTLGAGLLVSCQQTEPPVAPSHNEAERDDQAERDRLVVQRRRIQLQNQLLVELRKLRESRQASMGGGAEPARDEPAVPAAEYDLLVFGGPLGEAFLGCLCDSSRPDSIFSMLGEHGSDLSPSSLRSKFSPYGSNYDDTSACNAEATHPPLVATSDGKSIGLLTVNPALKRRITTPSVADWLTHMCTE